MKLATDRSGEGLKLRFLEEFLLPKRDRVEDALHLQELSLGERGQTPFLDVASYVLSDEVAVFVLLLLLLLLQG